MLHAASLVHLIDGPVSRCREYADMRQ
jgi:hypothetical protein